MCDLKTHWYWIWCDPHCLIALCEWMEFSKIDESYPIIKYLDGKQKPGSYVTCGSMVVSMEILPVQMFYEV